jgi:hypothetical protein
MKTIASIRCTGNRSVLGVNTYHSVDGEKQMLSAVTGYKLWMLAVSGTVLLSSSVVRAAGNRPMGIVISCDCGDIVGSRFCFALKEKIRASAGFKLQSEDDKDRWTAGAHVLCIDPDRDSATGLRSVVAMTITTTAPLTAAFYLTTIIYVIGRDRVDDMASSALSDIDKEEERYRQP